MNRWHHHAEHVNADQILNVAYFIIILHQVTTVETKLPNEKTS